MSDSNLFLNTLLSDSLSLFDISRHVFSILISSSKSIPLASYFLRTNATDALIYRMIYFESSRRAKTTQMERDWRSGRPDRCTYEQKELIVAFLCAYRPFISLLGLGEKFVPPRLLSSRTP